MQNKLKMTDDQLVAAYIKGDNKAFDTLINRHQSYIYTYILRLVKDAEIADDIFQETFVKAITTIKQNKYTGDGRFLSWLTRISHNLIIDFFRQEKATTLCRPTTKTPISSTARISARAPSKTR